MQKKAEIRVEGNQLQLAGDLDFSNVMKIYRNSLSVFSSDAPVINADFSHLTSANSVVLALIINWIRLARQANKTLQINHVSEEVLSLARASGLDKVFLASHTSITA